MTGNLHTAFEDSRTSPGFMLWRVTNSWQREIRAALLPYDLTHVQFVLLAVLTSMDQSTPITQRDLAARASVDTMMTSQVIRVLERKGLVERQAHPADGRAKAVVPTSSGIERVNLAIIAVEESDRTYFSALNGAENAFTRHLELLDSVHTNGSDETGTVSAPESSRAV